MKKPSFLILILASTALILFSLYGCNALKSSLDQKTGFSTYLKQTETHIRNEKWQDAKESITLAINAWEDLKPFLQIDIDHDYVNQIEGNFIKLEAYIETTSKPNSLATILLIQDDWDNLNNM